MLQPDFWLSRRSMYNEPIPVPLTDPGATPGSTLTLSCEWWSYLVAAVGHMLSQGVWASTDQAVISEAVAKVYDLMYLITQAADSGGCETVPMDCNYDFTAEQANPWVAVPTPDYLGDPEWVTTQGWVGAYNVAFTATESEVIIQADFIPQIMTHISFVQPAGIYPSVPIGDWAIRVYDHNLDLMLEVDQDVSLTTTWDGFLPDACRVILRSHLATYYTVVLGLPVPSQVATISSTNVQGASTDGSCTQIVPLADPPTWCKEYDFTGSDYGGAGSGPWVWTPGSGYVIPSGGAQTETWLFGANFEVTEWTVVQNNVESNYNPLGLLHDDDSYIDPGLSFVDVGTQRTWHWAGAAVASVKGMVWTANSSGTTSISFVQIKGSSTVKPTIGGDC